MALLSSEDTSGVEAIEVGWGEEQLAAADEAIKRNQMVLFRSCIGRAKNLSVKSPRSRALIDERVFVSTRRRARAERS